MIDFFGGLRRGDFEVAAGLLDDWEAVGVKISSEGRTDRHRLVGELSREGSHGYGRHRALSHEALEQDGIELRQFVRKDAKLISRQKSESERGESSSSATTRKCSSASSRRAAAACSSSNASGVGPELSSARGF
jgi:hypothetical protein